MPLIELKNLHKRFGHLIVLDGVSLSIEAGERLVVIGASGTGKSVLLKHIVGLLKPDKGEVWFDGRRTDQLRDSEFAVIRPRFGFLFQMSALFDSLTCAENVAFPLVEHTKKPKEEIAAIVQQRLAMVGLPDVGPKLPSQLSGGQRKRIALARAIAMEPQVVMYDEPTTGLDPIRSDVINELILKLSRELPITSLIVTHDMTSAFKIATRIVMLYHGKVVFDGTPDEARASESDVLRRFIAGEATDEELAGLNSNLSGAPRLTQ